MNLTDLIWTLAGFLFTLMVFSYVLGDNFLFRLAMYIFCRGNSRVSGDHCDLSGALAQTDSACYGFIG